MSVNASRIINHSYIVANYFKPLTRGLFAHDDDDDDNDDDDGNGDVCVSLFKWGSQFVSHLNKWHLALRTHLPRLEKSMGQTPSTSWPIYAKCSVATLHRVLLLICTLFFTTCAVAIAHSAYEFLQAVYFHFRALLSHFTQAWLTPFLKVKDSQC